MATITVSIGTLAEWFGKNQHELGEALFTKNDEGEKTPKEQSEINEALGKLFSSRLKSFESTVRDQGHKRGLKETAEKVEAKLKEFGVEADDWNQGIESLAKQSQTEPPKITDEIIKGSALYKDIHQKLIDEREAHEKTKSGHEQKEIQKSVKTYFTDFITKSNYNLPSGDTDEDKALRANWVDMFVDGAMSKSKWKLVDGKPIPVNDDGSPLEIDYKPVTASNIAEQTASRMFKKLSGTPRGGEQGEKGGVKQVKINGDKILDIPKPNNDEEYLATLNQLSNNPDVPMEVIENFVKEYE